MAISFPSLPKLSGRTVAVLAAVGALAVGVVAAGAAKDQPAGTGTPAAGPAPQTPADQATDAARTPPMPNEGRSRPPGVPRREARPGQPQLGHPDALDLRHASTTCNLMYGDDPHRGSTVYGDPDTAIQVLQRNLNFCYGSKLAVDGIYGSNTRAVVKIVQRKHKLVADGIYGPKTRSAMNWRLYSSATQSWSKGCSSLKVAG